MYSSAAKHFLFQYLTGTNANSMHVWTLSVQLLHCETLQCGVWVQETLNLHDTSMQGSSVSIPLARRVHLFVLLRLKITGV